MVLKLNKSLYGLRQSEEIGKKNYVVINVILDLPSQM